MGQAYKHRLRDDLERMRSALERSGQLTLADQDRQELNRRLDRIDAGLRAVEDETLIVGLLGGTGVGKSSLMNSLAGAEIASASFRRPHTDRVLVYAYEDAPVPDFIREPALPLSVIEHQAADIKQVLLCDLPDFDSLMGGHSETVNTFLKHLDLLVWVASPEKYADGRMYEMMRQTPKAGSNFVFVLNKADQLTGGGQESGLEQLQSVSRGFAGHLDSVLDQRGESAIRAESRLYVLSATETGPGWNQLRLFQEHVFARRNMKQVAAIKSANLEEELRRVSVDLRAEMEQASRAESVLAETLEALQQDLQEWESAVGSWIAEWVARDIKPLLTGSSSGERLLVGPARWIRALASEWSLRRSGPGNGQRAQVPDHVLSMFTDCREHLRTGIRTSLLRHQVPDGLRKRIETELGQAENEHIRIQWQGFVRSAVQEFRPRSRLAFVLGQRGVYSLLTLLLLLALGGRDAWVSFLQAPGATTGLDLLFALIKTVFSATGLAALLSFGLLCTLAGARFFRRFRTVMDQEAEAWASTLADQLLEHWRSDQERLLDRLAACREELRQTVASIRNLVE